jgi:hypothetical protein
MKGAEEEEEEEVTMPPMNLATESRKINRPCLRIARPPFTRIFISVGIPA